MRARAATAILAMVLGACGGDGDACTPGESRACTCATGAIGAQVCDLDGSRLGPCECATGADAGELDGAIVDADAGAREDAGTEIDAGARDAGVDAGPADGGPPWGECWIVPQAGCEAGEACRVDGPIGEEWTPTCEAAGTRTDQMANLPGGCIDESGTDLCAPGFRCYTSGWPTGCIRYCAPGDACPNRYGGDPQTCQRMEIGEHAWYECRP